VSPPPADRFGPGSDPSRAARLAGMSRGWLIFLTITVLGALVLPLAWEHPSLSRREKIFIIALGCLQTLAAVVVFAFFVVWVVGWFRAQLAG